MNSSDLKQLQDGEWIRPAHKGFEFTCCDCGLTHTMDFRVTPEGDVEFQATRDDLLTIVQRQENQPSLSVTRWVIKFL